MSLDSTLSLRLRHNLGARPTVLLAVPSPGDLELALYDLRGRRGGRADGRATALTLDRPLPSGVYLLRARSADGSVASVKLTAAGAGLRSVSIERTEHDPAAKSDEPAMCFLVVIHPDYQTHVAEVAIGPGHNEFFVNMNPLQGHELSLGGDAWGLLDNPLYGGTVFLRNAGGEVFSAPVDSSWSLDYRVSGLDESVELWFEHPEVSASGVLFPQGMPLTKYRVGAARNFGPSDNEVITFSADNPNLALAPESLRYKAVDNQWADNSIWRALLYGSHITRGQDRPHKDGSWTIEVWRRACNVSQGTWYDFVSQADLDKMLFVAHYRSGLLSGSQADGTVYAHVGVEVHDQWTGELFDKQFIYVDPSQGPGNSRYTVDGFLESHFASTPPSTPLGTVAAEAHNEMLTDYNGSLAVALEPGTGTLNSLGRAATNAYLLFPHRTNFNGDQWPVGLSGEVLVPDYLKPDNLVDRVFVERFYDSAYIRINRLNNPTLQPAATN